MLLDKPFPPDPRVGNEARSLVSAGHHVRLLCVRFDRATPETAVWEGVEVERVLIDRGFYRRMGALALLLPAYFSFFRRALARFLDANPADVLHVHDLPLLSVGLAETQSRDMRLVADLHENYPAAIATYDYATRLPGRLLISPPRWRSYERRFLPKADRVIVVVDEAMERLRPLGIPVENIAVLPNTVHVDEFERFPRDAELERRLGGDFTVSYLGGFDRHRGLDTVVDAARRIDDPDVRWVLVGDGATRKTLEARVRTLGLADRISFEGWQPFERFPSYVAASKVCLIPHLRSEHTDTTIPHKLFHYMLLERPVVASDCRPLERILRASDAGLVYPSGDAASLAECVRRLRDPELAARLGRNGRQAVLGEHNWSRTERTLLDMYGRLELPR